MSYDRFDMEKIGFGRASLRLQGFCALQFLYSIQFIKLGGVVSDSVATLCSHGVTTFL
jgi:hypothetical protein